MSSEHRVPNKTNYILTMPEAKSTNCTASEANSPAAQAASILQSAPLLATKLARALFAPVAESDRALAEVIKFLTLAAETTHAPLNPSARVDVAWHEFILFTRTYSEFCQQQFGKYIHHEPSTNHELNSNQYAETIKRYRERFGQPPTDFWGGTEVTAAGSPTSSNPASNRPAAFCGNCESDS